MPATTLPNTAAKSFKIISVLGESSHSNVKLAEHPGVRNKNQADELVVVKTIKDFSLKRNYCHNADFLTLRSIEANIAALRRLRHPNIVQLYETIDDPMSNQMHLVMQYAKHRRPLLTVASTDGSCQKFDPATVAGVVARLISALRYLHRNGFVHGAVKPSNILVDGDDGTVRITDVGGSHWLFVPPVLALHRANSQGSLDGRQEPPPSSQGSRRDLTVLSSRFVVGGYASAFTAPEVRASPNGSAVPCAASDVWSLGVLMLTMLSGRVPQQLVGVGVPGGASGSRSTSLVMPSEASSLVKDCLTSMLHTDPRRRATLDELKRHAFFTQEQAVKGRAEGDDTLGRIVGAPTEVPSCPSTTLLRRFANPDIYSSDSTAHTQERARALSPMEDDACNGGDGCASHRKGRVDHAAWVAALVAYHAERRAAAKLRRFRVAACAVCFAIRLSRVPRHTTTSLAYCNSFYGVVPRIVVDAPQHRTGSSEVSAASLPSPPSASKQLRSPRSKRNANTLPSG